MAVYTTWTDQEAEIFYSYSRNQTHPKAAVYTMWTRQEAEILILKPRKPTFLRIFPFIILWTEKDK